MGTITVLDKSQAGIYTQGNRLKVTVDFSSATWNTVASHEVFIVTGLVYAKFIAVCTTNLTSGGAATIELGTATVSNALLAATTGTAIDVGEIWGGTTPATTITNPEVSDLVINQVDVGYEIKTAALTAGVIDFICYWVPMDDQSLVSEGAGGTL